MFITIEGIEGAGKTTISRLVEKKLHGAGKEVLQTREPGDNTLGRSLRPILLDARNSRLSPWAELFLFFADRAQHLEEVVRPALEEGLIVICDRFYDSTVAYQGYGRNLDLGKLELLNNLACNGLVPDLTILLDLPVETGLERAGKRNRNEGTVISEGRFDSESLDFHQRVRKGYLEIAKKNPQRMIVVDAQREPGEVAEECLRATTKMGTISTS